MIHAIDNLFNIYIFRESEIPFLDLATSIPKKILMALNLSLELLL